MRANTLLHLAEKFNVRAVTLAGLNYTDSSNQSYLRVECSTDVVENAHNSNWLSLLHEIAHNLGMLRNCFSA